jgi:predicted O-methyltransferase YrrM
MDAKTWTAVDEYLDGALGISDDILEGAQAAAKAAGLPEIAVAPNQGRLLHLLARLQGARRILEIGTLGGYSAIWLARALPADGRLVTLELDPKHADVARANLARAGLADRSEVRVGPALESLAALVAEGAGPFDLVFVDADKPTMPQYLEWALKLSRPGTLLVFDNVVREGAILDTSGANASVRGVRTLFERIAADPRLEGTALQTVGSKGYDGLAFALVTG